MAERFRHEDLIDFTARLFAAAGLDAEQARVTGELLVEADLMGHTTHGLQLAPAYLRSLAEGRMAKAGRPTTIAEAPAVLTLDGNYLPGLWLTATGIDAAIARARTFGTGTVVIRRSHHIGCLAAFLPRATSQGLMLILASSDPSVATVAPFGGCQPLFTPNPIAIGIPTEGDPILIDISASITTNAMSGRVAAGGGHMHHLWFLDATGEPTNDPAVVTRDPPGTILPVGGLDHGHKGYGLALMIEALTQALAGFGRAERPDHWGASVFIQALDPTLFGGAEAFLRQSTWLAAACRANPPRPGFPAVRVPGDAAMKRRRQALETGVELYPGIMAELRSHAERLSVTPPQALPV